LQESEQAAAVKREVPDPVAAYERADGRIVGVEERRLGSDRDDFFRAAKLKMEVGASGLGGVKLEPEFYESAEAITAHGDFVMAGIEPGKTIDAIRAGICRAAKAGFVVDSADARAWDERGRSVPDEAGECGGLLCGSRSEQTQQESCRQGFHWS
jgi:hypothetical protein